MLAPSVYFAKSIRMSECGLHPSLFPQTKMIYIVRKVVIFVSRRISWQKTSRKCRRFTVGDIDLLRISIDGSDSPLEALLVWLRSSRGMRGLTLPARRHLNTSESDVYRRQIMTYKDGPRFERIKPFIMAVDAYEVFK